MKVRVLGGWKNKGLSCARSAADTPIVRLVIDISRRAMSSMHKDRTPKPRDAVVGSGGVKPCRGVRNEAE